MLEKSPEAFKTISEAASELGVEQHVLRFWETKFPQIKPLKRRGGRRFYRPDDMEVLHQIKALLYGQGFTIKGAKKALSSGNKEAVAPAATAPAKPTINAAQAMAAAAKGKKAAANEDQLDLLSTPATPAETPAPVVQAGLTDAQRDSLQSLLGDLRGAQKRLQSAI